MGEKGARLTGEATDVATRLVEELTPLGDVSARKMFGGYGIFESGVMFVLIDSAGIACLRADDDTVARYKAVGGEKHGKMPYWSVPTSVLGDADELLVWAGEALDVARAAKKKTKKK